MNTEKLGEIFVDGKIINLESSSIEELDAMLEQINSQKEIIVNRIDAILEEIQN